MGTLGLQAKYYPRYMQGVGIIAQAGTVVHGRNVGKATSYGIGVSFSSFRRQNDISPSR
jgi:hypothetical protein